MPKIRDILVHVRVEQAQRKRICRRDSGIAIMKGDFCLVVKTNPTNDDYSYSRDHAKIMLDAAWVKLRTLYNDLNLSPP